MAHPPTMTAPEITSPPPSPTDTIHPVAEPPRAWGLADTLGVLAVKAISATIRALGKGSATSLPAKLVLLAHKKFLNSLGHQLPTPRIMLSGTNGKTTTATLIRDVFQAHGQSCLLNEKGANLVYGIATSLGQAANPFTGRYNATAAVIETDEATVGKVAPAVRPNALAVTNLFRDQLDRYGELSTTANFIAKGIPHTQDILFLNADDPLVVAMGRDASRHGLSVKYFGLTLPASQAAENISPINQAIPHPQEVATCPECSGDVSYYSYTFAHLGHWHCTHCGTERPPLDVSITPLGITDDGWALEVNTLVPSPLGERAAPAMSGAWERGTAGLDITYKKTMISSPLLGLYNAYNIAQTAVITQHYNIPFTAVQGALNQHSAMFGRAERKTVKGKNVCIMLIKNPAGASEVLRIVAQEPKANVMIALNDNYADGEDVSWIWDADFEQLLHAHPNGDDYFFAGTRAYDIANRLTYATTQSAWQPAHIDNSVEQVLRNALAATATDETLYILPTYSALLRLEQLWDTF